MTDEKPYTYTFANEGNSYFNGSDAVATRSREGEEPRSLKLNGKDGMLAISVKDYATMYGWINPNPRGNSAIPDDVLPLAIDLNKANESRLAGGDQEQWTEVLYERAQRRFWDDAEELAMQAGIDDVYQAGRSGGWLCLAGTNEDTFHRITQPEDEDDRAERERIFGLLFEILDAMDEARAYFFEMIREEHAELEVEREQVLVRGTE